MEQATGGRKVFWLIDPGVLPTLLFRLVAAGAENVIRSVIKAKTVQKLIVTSSVAAIRNPADDRPGKTYSHEDWSDSSNLDMPYFVAKVS